MRVKTNVESLIQESKQIEGFISKMFPAALSEVPFHHDTESITRYFTSGFPLHLAVHQVSFISFPPEQYTLPHLHGDSDEINVILSPNKLLYKIQIGGDERIVGSNSAIWIPRGMMHSANVVEGEGYFVTLRLPAK
jgi:hypothetical protein